jgi:hypothetical protein
MGLAKEQSTADLPAAFATVLSRASEMERSYVQILRTMLACI